MYNEVISTQGSKLDNSEFIGQTENRKGSKLTELKRLLIEIREANLSLVSRTRDFKEFLCGNYPEVNDLAKDPVKDEPNGELAILLAIARDIFDAAQMSHDNLNRVENETRP